MNYYCVPRARKPEPEPWPITLHYPKTEMSLATPLKTMLLSFVIPLSYKSQFLGGAAF